MLASGCMFAAAGLILSSIALTAGDAVIMTLFCSLSIRQAIKRRTILCSLFCVRWCWALLRDAWLTDSRRGRCGAAALACVNRHKYDFQGGFIHVQNLFS